MKKALIFDTYDDYNIRIQYIKSALERNGYETMIYFAETILYKEKRRCTLHSCQ